MRCFKFDLCIDYKIVGLHFQINYRLGNKTILYGNKKAYIVCFNLYFLCDYLYRHLYLL